VQPPFVRLIVLNYNGGSLVQRCVEHLEALDWPADRLDLVVVDNASQDGSDRLLEGRPRVRLVRSAENLGFPGNNLAMGDLDGVDYVGLVNNDAFVEPDYLAPLVEVLAGDPSIGAACPKILLADRFADLRIQTDPWTAPGDGRELGVRISGLEVDGVDRWGSAGVLSGVHAVEPGGPGEPEFRWTTGDAVVRVPMSCDGPLESVVRVRLAGRGPADVVIAQGASVRTVVVDVEPRWFDVAVTGPVFDVINNAGSLLIDGGWGADRGFLQRDRGQFDEEDEVFAWCGGAVLFPARYLREAGLFDRRFFLYYEDTDLSWRGRAQGWRYRYVPASVVRHVHAASSVEGSPLFHHYVERNRLAMLAKNAPARYAIAAVARFLLSTLSYARRDVLRPILRLRRPHLGLVRARVRSFGSFLLLSPHLLAERRHLRRRQRVADAEILAWSVPQPPDPT
jgi:GT2 family glycosyltransferase